jgi:TRAP-type C4-dicarboxylate transport system permease small subunit
MLKVVHRVAQLGVWAGGLAMIALAFLVSIEVVLRTVFLIGLSAAADLSSYTLAVSTAWAFSFALLARAHVRVDALIHLLPRRAAALVDIVALAALTWFAAVLVWYGYTVFAESYARDARAMTPLGMRMWIPQGLWVAGLTVFLVTCIAVLVRAVTLMARGRVGEVSALIGTLSTREGVDAEIKDAAERRRATARPADAR